MQDDDVERVARALCALMVSRTSDDWLRYRQEDSWMLFVDEVRAAMVVTLELAAEELRTISDERLSKSTDAESGDMALGMLNAADWLQQRAKGVTNA